MYSITAVANRELPVPPEIKSVTVTMSREAAEVLRYLAYTVFAWRTGDIGTVTHQLWRALLDAGVEGLHEDDPKINTAEVMRHLNTGWVRL